MKKALAILLAAVMLLSLAGCSGTAKNYILASGGTSGTYYPFGGAMGQLINGHVDGANVTVQATGASKENIRLIASDEADLAIVQNDTLAYSAEGIEQFEGEKVEGVSAIATLYPEVVQVVVAADSGINSIADLAGKRVSVGDAGSGVELNAKHFLSAYGLTFDDIKKQNLSFKDSGDALKNGQLDAYFVTAGVPNTSIVDVKVQKDVRLLSITGAEADKLMADYPFYTPYTIGKDVYTTADDAVTLAVSATLIVREELSEQEVYDICCALFDNLDEFGAAHAKGKEVTVEGAVKGIPVAQHAGAVKYFTEKGVL